MQVNLKVSVAFALDFLSILEVKKIKTGQHKDFLNWAETLDNLTKELGNEFIKKILFSDEYLNLFNANEAVYEFIDGYRFAEKENKYKFSYDVADFLNLERFKCKNRLQEKFFGEKTNEHKITYE